MPDNAGGPCRGFLTIQCCRFDITFLHLNISSSYIFHPNLVLHSRYNKVRKTTVPINIHVSSEL